VSIKKLGDGRYEWRHRVGGRHLKKTFARRTDAVAHDSKVKADLARGTHVDTSNRVTVAEYARAWSQARVLRSNTRHGHDNFLRHHLEGDAARRSSHRQGPPFGGAGLDNRPRGRGRPGDAARARRAAAVGFAAAVLDGVVARNPVLPDRRLSLPRQDKAKFVPLTVAQVRAWADAAAPRVRAMIITQAALGLRISELRAVRVQDVDFLRREVHVDEQLDASGRHRAPLKTANSRRVVPLPAVAAETLAAHIAEFPPGPDGLIFTTVTGRPWASSRITWRAYRDAAEAAAGLPPGTSSHDLRHHYASVLLAAGESVHAVAERLGDTAAMVLSTYGHVMPDREDTTRRAVDTAWSDAQPDAARGAR